MPATVRYGACFFLRLTATSIEPTRIRQQCANFSPVAVGIMRALPAIRA
jgi:hypothetical protein